VCGFVAIRRFDGLPVDPVLLHDLGALLTHRGPDGDGLWVEGSIGFSHRRLTIIDPVASDQPMGSADGSLHIAFNGEILNYRELRSRLRYPFRTDGDTEVLLACHRELGERAVHELRGQFAYAVHDARDGSTWLVRDRLGVLPLYYIADARFVAFASEAKALLPLLRGGVHVETAALDAYLARGAVPAPATLFRGVRKLPPGHLARLGPDGSLSIRRYWSLPPAESVQPQRDTEAIAALHAALVESIDLNLVADVPVGAYLSGGVDSSLIAALASQRVERLATFAAGFGDRRVDETHHARAVSDHLGTDHTEITVRSEDFTELWPRLTWHRDAPLSQPADVAVYLLASAARERVKVVLSGEGSDELFAGYPKHRFAGLTAGAGIVPGSVRRAAARTTRYLPGSARRLGVAARALAAGDEDQRFAGWFAPFSEGERASLLRVPAHRPVARHDRGGDALRRMLVADAGAWLADNLLERGDRMTMAASVELRPPFLDHRLAEFAFRLPSSLKLRDRTGKWVVRQVARPLLPEVIAHRPKAGFRVPLDAWFCGGLREFAWDHLLPAGSFVSTVFDRNAVRDILLRHDRRRGGEEARIWTLLGLEVWHEACVAGSRVPVSRKAS
jgi:asparagine synthase (glutamine-hydrolysing)